MENDYTVFNFNIHGIDSDMEVSVLLRNRDNSIIEKETNSYKYYNGKEFHLKNTNTILRTIAMLLKMNELTSFNIIDDTIYLNMDNLELMQLTGAEILTNYKEVLDNK